MLQDNHRVKYTALCLIVLFANGVLNAADWPTYQADNRRRGISEESLTLPLYEQWTRHGGYSPAPAWPEMPAQHDYWHNVRDLNPTNTYDRAFHVAVAEGKLYYGASAEDAVYCLDARSGDRLWVFYTEGPVRLAPALYQGKVYVGSDDGRVYCLDAGSGQLVWSRCPAGSNRKIPGNGRMMSVWPVRSGIVVQKDVAYACAGFFPNQGVTLCALDAHTGQVIWTQPTDVSAQGYLRCSSTHLLVPTGRTAPVAFDLKTGKKIGGIGSGGGSFALVLDDMIVQGGNEKGQLQISEPATKESIVSTPGLSLIAQGPMIYILKKSTLCALNRRDYLRFSTAIKKIEKVDRKKRTRGQTQQLIQLQAKRKACLVWEVPCPESVAMIMMGNTLLLGSQDKVTAMSADKGHVVWTSKVKGKAYGLAVADGYLYVSTDQGTISCFGQNPVKTSDPSQGKPSFAEGPSTWPSKGTKELARELIAQSTVRRGYALVLGSGDGQLACELARQSDLSIVGIEEDALQVRKAREQISGRGLYGKRLSIHQENLKELPYQDYVANLIVCDLSRVQVDRLPEASKLYRFLRPGGGVLALVYPIDAAIQDRVQAWAQTVFDDLAAHKNSTHAWTLARRKPLAQAGQWTHLYADPANTSCSNEPSVTDTLRLAWFGRPGPRHMIDRHHRSMSPLYKNGQLFMYGNDRVISSDAYNGTVLWETPVPGSLRNGMMNDCGNMCVDEDTVYVAAEGRCWLIDVATGLSTKRYATPELSLPEKTHWGYVAVVGDQLFGSTQKPSSSFTTFGFGNDSVGQIEGDFKLKALSSSLFSMDRHTGQLLWRYENGLVLNSAIGMDQDHIYFVENRDPKVRTKKGRISAHLFCRGTVHLVALDKTSGQVAWDSPFEFPYEHQVFLSCAQGQVVIVGSENINKS
ncbi:MAG: PQQ-binding-like beta-propeller repeat protein, partial [Phycisphaeraceae bacterium]|nr:PQQ-binding-like beta-propeller repeat protein [Phycisphaeraceae bacterium]